MASSMLALAILAAAPALTHAAYNAHSPYADKLGARTLTTTAADLDGKTFDFVVAGGGVGGLAIAARLAEWENTTVAVIEAGGDGTEFTDRINIAGNSYLDGLTGTDFDWQYKTEVQADANGTVKTWPRGKGLGGSGAINGLFWVRPADVEFDAWDTLNPDGENSWNGEVMTKYMNKAENFTAPTAEQQSTFNIVADMSAHGTDGPIQAGFSAYIYDAVKYWVPTFTALGFANIDQHGGNNHGVNLTPSSLNPSNQTRSYSKSGYVDPYYRPNLVILTGYQVTEIVWNSTTSGSAVAGGVKFAASKGGTVYEVNAGKEVILAGGTVNSPQMLQLSGVGPSDLLTGLGITVVSDLPVGYNLQDHVSASVAYNTSGTEKVWGEMQNKTYAAADLVKYKAGDFSESEWTYINEATFYASMADIDDDYATYASTATSALTTNVNNMVSWNELPDTVATGLKAQYQIQNEWLSNKNLGQLEIILNMMSGATGAGIQCALQHPYSRGTILINSTEPFDYPVIDPKYFGLGYDIDIMAAGFAFVRKVGGSAPLNTFLIVESAPGTTYTGDTLNTYIKQQSGTEYHPLGTCPMLPQASGGVVDTNLIVYGTTNLRVVDASVAPLQVSAHLMQMTYGIAERAADLVKAKYAAQVKTASSSAVSKTATSASASSSSAAGAVSGNTSTAAKTTAMSTSTRNGVIGGVVGGVAALAALALLALVLARKRKAKAGQAAQQSFYSTPEGDDAWDSGYAKEAGIAAAAGYGAGSSMRLDALAARSTDALDQQPPMAFAPAGRHNRIGSLGSVASYDTAGMGGAAPMEHSAGPQGGWYDPTSGHSSYHDSPAASGATSPYHDDSPRSSFPQSPTAEHTPLSPAYGAQPGQIFNASHPSYR